MPDQDKQAKAKQGKQIIWDKICKSDAANWLWQATAQVIDRYSELKGTSAKTQNSQSTEGEGFDVEAYIAALEAESKLERPQRQQQGKAEEGGPTKEVVEIDWRAGETDEQKTMLIEMNRQVALHRKARKNDGTESEAVLRRATLTK